MDDTAAQLTPQQAFQEKLEARIRKDIGDLMPDDALMGILDRATEKAFFEERTVKEGYHERKVESWSVTILRELLEERMKVALEKWILANDEKFKEMVAKRLDEGIASAFVKSFDRLMQNTAMSYQQDVSAMIEQLRIS